MYEATNHLPEYMRHQSLERRRCVTVSLLNYPTYEGTLHVDSKCGLMHVLLDNTDLLVCFRHIDFRSISRSCYIIPYAVLIRERSSILDRVSVTLPTVENGPQSSILLGDA